MRSRAPTLALVACAATVAVDATCAADPFATTGQLLDQRYVVAGGTVGAHVDLTIFHLAMAAGTSSVRGTQEGLDVGASYGVTDQLTAGVDYAFPFAGDGTETGKGLGPLRGFGMFLLTDTDRLTVTGSADLDHDLCGDYTMGGSCASITTLHVGVGLKYKLAPTLALFTGAPFGPGPAGEQFSARLDTPHTIELDLPAGVAFQATPQLFAFAETNLAHLRLANASTGADAISPIFSDSDNNGLGVPLQLGGYLGVTKTLHVGATVELTDLVHAGDRYTVLVGARFFPG